MKQGVMALQRVLGEVQLIPLVSFSLPLPPLFFSSSIPSSELQPGKIFSKESDVNSCALSSLVCVFHVCVLHCTAPTCRPRNTLLSQLL